MKLRLLLLFKLIRENSYIILIQLILLFLLIYFKNIIIFFLFFFTFLKVFKYQKILSSIIFILSLVILINLIIFHNHYENVIQKIDEEKNVQVIGKIVNIAEQKNYQKLIIKIDDYQALGYLYDEKCDSKLKCGMIILLKGRIKQVEKVKLEGMFDHQKYLYYQKVFAKIEIDELEILKSTFSIRNLHLFMCRYYDKNFSKLSSGPLKALLLGDKISLEEDMKEKINSIGISHLFVVSGLHVTILISLINVLLKPFKMKENVLDLIDIIVIFGYVILTNFMISVIRVFISLVLKRLTNNSQFNSFNLFAINTIIVMVFQPIQIFTYSFILSYMISGIILLSKKILAKKSYFKQMLLISIISALVTLPVIISIQGNINFLSVFYNLFYIPLVGYILLPFSILVTVFPFLTFFYEFIIALFNNSLTFFSSFDIFDIIFPHLPIFFYIIYYIIIYSFFLRLENKMNMTKNVIILITYLIFISNIKIFNGYDSCSFLNVSVGDATLICDSFNKMNILIDTGEDEEICLYLKKKGIKRLDYLIISHGDFDHMGQLANLIDNFLVKNIIISKYDENSLQVIKQIKLQKNTKVRKVSKGMVIHCGKYSFKVLGPLKKYDDINDNSIVMIGTVENIKILFTGDISKNAEADLIKIYPKIKVDILKVAHHGSNTSSSTVFLSAIDFKIAIAMNGYNNTFGFPHPAVISRFSSYLLYNTSDFGTITFKKLWFQGDFYQKK